MHNDTTDIGNSGFEIGQGRRSKKNLNNYKEL